MFDTFAKFSSFDFGLLTLFTPFVEMLCLILFLVNSSLCIWLFFHLSVAPDTDFGAHNQQISFPKLPILSLIFPENRKIQSGHPTLNLKTLTVFRAVHTVSRYGLLFRVSPCIQISRRYYSVFGKSLICYVWICVTWQISHSSWTLRRVSLNFERVVFGLDFSIQFDLICSFDLFGRVACTKESQTLFDDCHSGLSFFKNRKKDNQFYFYIFI